MRAPFEILDFLTAGRKSNGSRGAWWPESPRGEKIQWLTGGTGGGRNLPAVRKSNGPRGMLNRVRRLSIFWLLVGQKCKCALLELVKKCRLYLETEIANFVNVVLRGCQFAFFATDAQQYSEICLPAGLCVCLCLSVNGCATHTQCPWSFVSVLSFPCTCHSSSCCFYSIFIMSKSSLTPMSTNIPRHHTHVIYWIYVFLMLVV